MNSSGKELQLGDVVRMVPPLDDTVEALLAASVEDRGVDAVMSLVENDPGLCADLLFLSNTRCFNPGWTAPVTDLRDALTVIGVSHLATAVGAAYAQCVVREQFGKPSEWDAYIRHSQDISHGCSAVATVLGVKSEQRRLLRVAGLTHDIGRVVILSAQDGSTANLLGTPPDRLMGILDEERAAWGLDHCRLGHGLFEKWRLADELKEGILRHHSPLIDHDYSFWGAVIFLAHFVTMSQFTGDEMMRFLPAQLFRELSLRAADLDEARRLISSAV